MAACLCIAVAAIMRLGSVRPTLQRVRVSEDGNLRARCCGRKNIT
jgi:hypothetical protein